MKYLTLAVFLAIMQTPAPVPRKAPDSSAKASRNVKHNRNADKAPTQQPIPNGDSVASKPKQDTGSEIQRNNEQEPIRVAELPPVSIRSTWIDCLSLLFAGALVGVGIYGVVMARRTLNAIERQAKANEGQLTEIQQSAEKTDRMILLAAQQAEHGRISAQAAKASADALKGIERALIIVTLEASARTPTGGSTAIQIQGAEQSTAAVTIICQNEGKSPAWLIDVWARFEVVDTLPDEPLLTEQDALDWSHSEPILVGKYAGFHWTATSKRRWDSGNMAALYGIVNYRDIFGESRSTTFGYQIARNGGLDRMNKYLAYNKHT